MKLIISIVTYLSLVFLPTKKYIFAQKEGEVRWGGAYLGLFDHLHQQSLPDTSGNRTKFDMAANLDISWQVRHNIRGAIQLQMGTGLGEVGFGLSQVIVTDLLIEIMLNKRAYLTVGSFDTPFGAETPFLTNNADVSANAFVLNTLFYGAFAGTNVGTLNTIGIKGEYLSKYGLISGAITNGTDELSVNDDGNFEIVLSVLSEKFVGGLQIGHPILTVQILLIQVVAVLVANLVVGCLMDSIISQNICILEDIME